MVAKPIFRYRFKVGGKVVHCGITADLARREHEHRRRWPTGRIEQVGPATTREEAWHWERQQAEQRFSSAS
jgi:predicted GIY-YIG superfamily endonuclease